MAWSRRFLASRNWVCPIPTKAAGILLKPLVSFHPRFLRYEAAVQLARIAPSNRKAPFNQPHRFGSSFHNPISYCNTIVHLVFPPRNVNVLHPQPTTLRCRTRTWEASFSPPTARRKTFGCSTTSSWGSWDPRRFFSCKMKRRKTRPCSS